MSGVQVSAVMASHNSPPEAYQYWRLRTSGWTGDGFWNLQSNTVQNIVSEAGDLTGTNIAASLTGGSNIGWGTSTPAYAAVGTNSFSGTGLSFYTGTSSGITMYFNFGSPKKFKSLKHEVPAGYEGARQPPTMYLEGSSDGTNWDAYATLTNAGHTISHWRNISRGSTVAATNS